MKKKILLCAAGTLLFNLGAFNVVSAEAVTNDAQNRCIVTLKDSVDGQNVRGLANAFAKQSNASLKHVYTKAIKGFTINMPCHAAETAFGDSDDVLSMEVDSTVSIDKKPSNPGGGKGDTTEPAPSQSVSYGTTRVGAVDGTGKTAWIIDTGVDLNHPDLNVDSSRGFSAIRGGSMDDQNGHGTHVAGIIGAIDNNIGSLGVAQNTTIVPVRVLDRRGSGSTSGVIAGVDYVAANASSGDCVNMSLGGGVSLTLDSAVINAASTSGAYFTLAAGNESDDANNHSPARANGTNVFTISAIDSNDYMAYFSNFGNPPIDYAAPGVAIFSLWKSGGTNTISGTSMAAPHACAVLMSTNGLPSTDGVAFNDPDGNNDPIIHQN